MSKYFAANGKQLVYEEFRVPTEIPGIEIFVRNKRLAWAGDFPGSRTVVLIHGATFSSGSLYDVPFNGMSFLDFLASEGNDVYALDVRGYGKSSRPPEMELPAEKSLPAIGTDVGVRDLAAVVDHVLKLCGLTQVCVFGMSWGGTVAAAYASRNQDKVHKLALLAPQWLSDRPIPIDSGGPLGAYRLVPVRDAESRWLGTAPGGRGGALVPSGWFQQWADFTLDEDPWSGDRAPGCLRASNGPIQDIRDYWRAGRPYYDPSSLRVPVLLVHGEWDIDVTIDLARALFDEFKNAPYRQWVEIGEATHLVLLEKNRKLAYRAISDFFAREFEPEQGQA
jgi:pimeloyl-ACP methyl ester carboxylesterase